MEIKVKEADEAKSLYLCCSKELFRCPDVKVLREASGDTILSDTSTE